MLQRFLINLRGTRYLHPFILFLSLFVGIGECIGQAPLAVNAVATSACSPGGSQITVAGVGGTGNYTYSVDGSAFQASGSFPGPYASGPHSVAVFDRTLIVTNTLIIDCFSFTTNTSTATCGVANGSMTINVSDGVPPSVPPYRYSIDNGVSYQASSLPTFTFSNIPGGMYDVIVKDANNTIATQSVIVGGLSGASITPIPSPAGCNNNDGSIDVQTTGGLAGISYKLDNGSYGSSNVFTGLASGDHTVYVTDGNACSTSATVTVPVNNTLSLTMGADATICEGKSTTLSPKSPNGVSFAWTPATGLNNTTTLTPVANPTTTTTYTLVATWGVCTQTGTETVNVNPAPIADAGPSDTTCYGKSTTLQGSGTGPGVLTYLWSPTTFLSSRTAASPTVIKPTATTIYLLRVTDGNGCTSLNNTSATVVVTPPPQVYAGADTNVAAGQPVPLHATDISNSGFVSYDWTPAAGLIPSSGTDVVVVAASVTTSYVVTGTTALGCLGVDTVTVKVFNTADIYVPSAFSPNHDGHNDVLRVIGPSIRELKVFAVYDRLGSQVFTTSNLSVGWDGTRGGTVLPAGTYVWMAVGVDFAGKLVEKKGTVVLVR
ncbi:MAG TPA: gliding motility-associated C-terminal domain-containing protein [Puia sp.]|uniref:T9SS type B sorting domain-containing protein n=1 Tax=Puia sp. TaxID=2045100 RepID=UPI002B5CE730|nr:gliding motility-associated C-terminal domain-containing protein [Puia sp.]HVU95962.1 gliding motility-associated C-terminal domain-containing protein [Puia sp.]